jgi:uncharacterized coiled-coil protein SlyX
MSERAILDCLIEQVEVRVRAEVREAGEAQIASLSVQIVEQKKTIAEQDELIERLRAVVQQAEDERGKYAIRKIELDYIRVVLRLSHITRCLSDILYMAPRISNKKAQALIERAKRAAEESRCWLNEQELDYALR